MNYFIPINPFLDSHEPEPILRDVFSGWELGAGIFSYIEDLKDMPWHGAEFVDSDILDIEYFGNHSGGKFCSPLVKMGLVDGVVPAEVRTVIAKIIISKYFTNWSRLWETNVLEYDPTTNYDMHETRNLAKSTAESSVETNELEKTGTETLTHGKVESIKHGMTNDTVDYAYGLNTQADNPKPSDKSYSEDGGTTVTENTGDDVTERDLQDSSTRSSDRVDAGEEEETVHRVGNIGVTTNQKLVDEERRLWLWNYFDQIFKDLDRELALSFHDPCRV